MHWHWLFCEQFVNKLFLRPWWGLFGSLLSRLFFKIVQSLIAMNGFNDLGGQPGADPERELCWDVERLKIAGHDITSDAWLLPRLHRSLSLPAKHILINNISLTYFQTEHGIFSMIFTWISSQLTSPTPAIKNIKLRMEKLEVSVMVKYCSTPVS